MPPIKRVAYAVLYIHKDCPVCESFFRTQQTKAADLITKAKVPLYVVDVETVDTATRLKLWGFKMTEYGIAMRVTVPLLAVYCVGCEDPVYVKELRPMRGLAFSEAEIREVLFLIRSFEFQCVRKGCPNNPGDGDEKEEEAPKRGRKKRASGDGV